LLPFLDGFRDITFVNVLVRMLAAVFCSAVIGLERSVKNRSAGFRTHILVCVGAATASLTGHYLYLVAQLPTDMTRIGAQVITGLGFIGAGTIIVTRKHTVKGLTTAAGLWATGVIGLAVGSGFYEGGILGTLMVILVETYFNSLRSKIRHAPEFEIALSYYHREDLDRVMRYCKDNDTVITDLRITGSKDSKTAMYNALITLKSDNDLDQEEFASQIEHMSGIISAQLI
jgi:putative Mg2+ transporter-C (MgtC) family protein